MSVLVVQHLVTLAEATRILRFFKAKKHAQAGYFFELQDLDAAMKDAIKLTGLVPYSDKPSTVTHQSSFWQEGAYLLRVHREVRPSKYLHAIMEVE